MEKQKMVAPDIKQVILVRNDLKMSPGKAAAQVGHAAILFMVHDLHTATDQSKFVCPTIRETQWMFGNGPIPNHSGQSIAYGGMKKIVLGVEDLDELWALHWDAKDAGLKVFNVFDEGVNDITACAIGPDYSDDIDKITGHLDLYGPPLKMKEELHPFDLKFTFDVDYPVKDAFKNWQKAIATESVIPRPRKRYRY
jgi:peptidyl-tRNA hydrolase, PTH2 family